LCSENPIGKAAGPDGCSIIEQYSPHGMNRYSLPPALHKVGMHPQLLVLGRETVE